jgi:hypothetical protein
LNPIPELRQKVNEVWAATAYGAAQTVGNPRVAGKVYGLVEVRAGVKSKNKKLF